ncbi:hypothetical protein JTB14_010928 [Gonioctena quinquepunctata]|nr:hypothetical protein JTB14_010928 [Gonioctena quinquepunctata]
MSASRCTGYFRRAVEETRPTHYNILCHPVNLAVETISASVADVHEFLMVDVCNPNFAGATIEYIRMIDRVFDLLYSRKPFGKGYKTTMKPETEKVWRPLLEETVVYLRYLKHIDGKENHNSKNKTPILG